MSNSLKYWISKYNLEPTGVLHAGAHLVQEREMYQELGIEPVLWVEAHPETAKLAANLLKNFPNQKLIEAALWSKSNHEITLTEAGNEGSSSSLLELGLITGSHPQVVCTNQFKVSTRTLEDILNAEVQLANQINFLCVDTQGAEAEVISGLGKRISNFNYILAEVSIRRLYKGAVLFRELTQILDRHGFILIGSNVNKKTGWGDAMYVRTSEVKRLGIREQDYEQIVISDRGGSVTKLRYLLLKIGIPNHIVAKISRKSNS